MNTKRSAMMYLATVVLAAVMGLSACGASVATVSTPGTAPGRPDTVRIESDMPVTSSGAHPVVTLTDVNLVRQLYAAIYALPLMPAQIACSAVGGATYTLTFRQSTTPLVTVLANRGGCYPVTIANQTALRQGTNSFWQQLDRAIYVATPPAHPAALAIQYTPGTTRVPQTARIASAATAQRLYDAILALKWSPWDPGCVETAMPRYQLVFHAPSQSVPALIHDTCNTIELNTYGLQRDYHTRSGVFVMDDRFKQLFQQIIGGATFAPASPDHLTLSIVQLYAAAQTKTITDTALMQRLVQETFRLVPIPPQPNCPPEADKTAGKGTWYTFSLSQWELPILRLEVYEGSCTLVELDYTSSQQVVQGNQAFWNLVHQLANQQ